MRLIRTELHNVCQHAHTELVFPLGITGVFGPNGAGKSNMIKMTQAGLTNDFSVNPGSKADNIRWGIRDSDYASITGQWEHEGTEFEVTRGLQNMGNKLVIAGDPNVMTKATEINRRINDLLGIPKEIIEGFIFVEQWKIFEFMSDKPSDRANTFAHLCNTARAEKAWEAIGKRSKTDQVLVAGVIDNSDEIHQRRAVRKKELKVLKSQVAELKKDVLKKADGKRCEQLVADWDKSQLLIEQLKGKVERLAALKAARKVATDDAMICGARLAQARDAANKLRKLATIATSALASVRDNAVKRARADKLLGILDKDKPKRPKRPKGYLDVIELNNSVIKLENDRHQAQHVLDHFDKPGLVECPTCGTTLENLNDQVSRAKSVVKICQANLSALDKLREKVSTYTKLTMAFKSDSAVYKASTEAARDELDEMGEVPDDPADEEQLRRNLRDFEEATASEAAQSRYMASTESDALRAETRYEECHAEIKSRHNDLDDLQVSGTAAAEARKKLKLHREARPALKAAKEMLDFSEQIDEDDVDALQQIEDSKERTTIATDWLSDLDEYRSILHREALPRIVAQSMLESMVDRVNETLEEFDGPFRVSADEDLSFIVHKPNGMTERAERLSGGEKVILAIAFRFAVNSLFAGEIGMMVLDEPTSGLDSANLDCLTDVLSRVSDLTRKRGQQLIVITHDRRLELVFDNIIEIEKAA
jgi:DNA repair exonuclease SbcCD ATPase subunit